MPNMTPAIAVGIALFPAQAMAVPPTFTGDVPRDFPQGSAVIIFDPGGVDVGVPLGFPPGTVSGNDIEDLRFVYDENSDTLDVGINTYGVAGDVDGDGEPGGTGPDLSAAGGVDIADFGGTESVSLIIDIDEDGIMDAIAGVSGEVSMGSFELRRFEGSVFTPGFSYGAPFPHPGPYIGEVAPSPSLASPDVECSIVNFSAIPPSSGFDSSRWVQVVAFIGSFSDAGVGEDYLPGVDSFERLCAASSEEQGVNCPTIIRDGCNELDDDDDGLVDEDCPPEVDPTPSPSSSPSLTPTLSPAPSPSLSQTPSPAPSLSPTPENPPTQGGGGPGDDHGCSTSRAPSAPSTFGLILLATLTLGRRRRAL